MKPDRFKSRFDPPPEDAPKLPAYSIYHNYTPELRPLMTLPDEERERWVYVPLLDRAFLAPPEPPPIARPARKMGRPYKPPYHFTEADRLFDPEAIEYELEPVRFHARRMPAPTLAELDEIPLNMTFGQRACDSTHNDKALGPVMLKAKRLGMCTKAGTLRPSLRSHLSGKPVWISRLVGEATA